jgi:hypothetical protein
MRVQNILVLAAVCIFGVAQAEAGFLDNLVNKTKNKVQQAVEQTVDKQVDKTIDEVKESPGGQSSPEVVAPSNKEVTSKQAVDDLQQSTADTSNRSIALAVVKLAPRFFFRNDSRVYMDRNVNFIGKVSLNF